MAGSLGPPHAWGQWSVRPLARSPWQDARQSQILTHSWRSISKSLSLLLQPTLSRRSARWLRSTSSSSLGNSQLVLMLPAGVGGAAFAAATWFFKSCKDTPVPATNWHARRNNLAFPASPNVGTLGEPPPGIFHLESISWRSLSLKIPTTRGLLAWSTPKCFMTQELLSHRPVLPQPDHGCLHIVHRLQLSICRVHRHG